VNAPNADAIQSHPAVHTVIPFDRKGMGSESRKLNIFPAIRFLRSLRQSDFDIVIDAQGLLRSGIFAWATRAKTRIGFADSREFGWLGLNNRICVPEGTHTVEKMMALLAPLEIESANHDMRLYTSSAASTAVESDQDLQLPYIVLAPTSLWEGKRWPISRFTYLAKQITNAGLRVVVIGAPGEEAQCQPLLRLTDSGCPVVNRVGKTDIATMMAIIERSKAVVANDSAALHMAVGFNRPIVALFGPTRTELVGPYKNDNAVIQHIKLGDVMDHKNTESGQQMMQRITTEEVWAAVIRAIEA
jgi:ADP-heptose:LPS heptosyltransferase